MTELAAGAVSSLLVVIRNEALLLSGVKDDVQFIKEEMESMNSFLAHLARSAPPGGDHDEQVRTWMNQVRLLAHDCNNCIDLYLYSGNPDIHRAKGRLRRYLWWAYWFLRKMVAQHRAAVQLRQLKDRARDVGERRLRYGVEVPDKSLAGQLSPAAGLMSLSSGKDPASVAGGGYAAADDYEDREDQLVAATATHHSGRRAVFEPRTLDDYVKAKLLEWVKEIPAGAGETLSIAIVAPDADERVLTFAQETLVGWLPPTYDELGYHRGILVNIPAVHFDFLPLRAKEILYYILWELARAESPSQDTYQGEEEAEGEAEEEEEEEDDEDEDGEKEKEEEEEDYLDVREDHCKRCAIYIEKKRVLLEIERNIKKMKIYEKLDKIKTDIQVRLQKGDHQQLLHLDLGHKKSIDQQDIGILLQMLLLSRRDQVKNRYMHMWDDNNIMKIAKKLKKHIEADEKVKELKGKIGAKEKEEIAKHEQKGEESEKEEKGDNGGHEEEKDNKAKEKGGGKEDDMNKEEEENQRRGDKSKEREEEENQRKGDEGKKREEEKQNGEDKREENGENKEGEKEKKDDNGNNNQEENNEDKEDDDDDEKEQPIFLRKKQYAQILREVFLKTSSSKPLQTQGQEQDRSVVNEATMTTTLDEERFKKIIQEAKQEVLKELQDGKTTKNQATGEPTVEGQNQKVAFEEITQKIEQIKQELQEKLKIKGIVDKIKHHLKKDCPLIILKADGMMDGSRWEEIRKALSLLECSADALIFTTTESIQQAKGYCYPPREPIEYSLAGLYHDTLLELTSQQKTEDNYNPQIFHDILVACEPYEFCMKIFTHALYANPKRSNEELTKLHRTLQASPKSFDIIAKKMLMYSYNDLPKEYKSCLLYLAIFPKGQKIRRSTLIERWIAEGMTLKEDWPSSVRQANLCFDALIHRWLVYPADIGATGKVKSCTIGGLVHAFITSIARKQHFVETRLSHHLARHFSVFNDLQLRSSDRIDKFFLGLSKSSRVSLLKVLDLEGCQCFGGKNQRYLKDICSKMLLLKYLSLRGTDITQLPGEINLLRELEVLDIRQTNVPVNATANILLLKLKRLLAGHNPSPSNLGTSMSPSNFGTSVRIPHRIDKMEHIEVLSNVKAQNSHDLKDIGKLWQLRKLGVVIKDKDHHLSLLLQTISDLHECLCSLSITTLPEATPHEGTPSSLELPASIASRLENHPKILESLSISGTTLTGHLLPVITNGGNNKIPKVTLTRTPLNQDDLKILAKLPKLQCVRLRYVQCNEPMFTFKEDEFRCLEYLLVEGSDLTNITFEDGAARELKKMVLSFTSSGSIAGVDRLLKLEELELNSRFSGMLLSSFDNAKQIAKLTLRGTMLEKDALQILAKKPNIRCLVLLEKSLHETQNEITLEKNEFPWLNHLIVDCSSITKIIFTRGSAPRLEKIVWSSFKSLPGVEYLSGIDKLPRLKEFNSDPFPKEVK